MFASQRAKKEASEKIKQLADMDDALVSDEMRKIAQKLQQNADARAELRHRLAEHTAKLVEQKFATGLLDELEELEKKELGLENEQLELLRQLFDATLAQRRAYLTQEQEKLGLSTSTNRESALSSSGGTMRGTLSSVLFGKSTRSALAKKGVNPFLDESEQSEGTSAQGSDLTHDISTWELKKEEIEISNEIIGKGSFGEVFKGKLRGIPVAVKTIKPNWTSEEEAAQMLDDFRNECAVMSKLKHPNVLLFMGVCIEEAGEQSKLIMVTELMPRGSVYNILHPEDPKKRIVFKQRMKFAKDAALALNCLHLSNPPIIHLDFKTQNLLVDRNWVAKVADFGLSRVHKPQKNKGATGSPVYMAPEVLSDKPYDQRADVYSFGIVLWELLTQEKPYANEDFKTVDEIYEHVVIEGNRPAIPPTTPPELVELIKSCWDEDPAKRPSFKQILESHVLDNVIIDAIISNTNALGRTFWKENFTTAEETHEVVGWKKFIRALAKFCKLEYGKGAALDNQLEVKILKLLLADNKDAFVTIESFSRILEWFGPFSADKTFIDRVMDIAALPGFYGDISGAEAEQVMAGKKPGHFIIRFSSQQPGYYTITAMSEENVLKHYRIKHKPGLGFLLGNEEYSNLKQLIKKHRKDLLLKRAVRESKFNGVITAHAETMESAYVEMSV